MQQTLDKIHDYAISYGVSVVAAIAIFIIGRFLAKFASKLVETAMLKAGINKTLASFGRHLAFYGVMTFVCIAALNKLGV